MGKLFSFRYGLLLSILLFSISLYGFVKEYKHSHIEDNSFSTQEDQYVDDFQLNPLKNNDLPNKTVNSDKDSSLPFNSSPIYRDISLNVSDSWITLGDSVDSLMDKLGSPNRIAKTEMDYDYYVYNKDYSKLLLVAIRENEVIGYYTDSIDFNYLDIEPGSSLDMVNKTLNSSFSLDYVLTHTTENYKLHIFMDELGSHAVTGISLLSTNVKEKAYTVRVMRDTELLVYDLTNSIRERMGLPLLSWSSTAARAAERHSKDMAEHSYFDHYDSYNNTPGDRLNKEGISYQSIGENIIAGYENAIISCHAWFNSPDHRDNILNKNFQSLGVGYTYLENSIYKKYITQIFYR